jgi:hypothetical protein
MYPITILGYGPHEGVPRAATHRSSSWEPCRPRRRYRVDQRCLLVLDHRSRESHRFLGGAEWLPDGEGADPSNRPIAPFGPGLPMRALRLALALPGGPCGTPSDGASSAHAAFEPYYPVKAQRTTRRSLSRAVEDG